MEFNSNKLAEKSDIIYGFKTVKEKLFPFTEQIKIGYRNVDLTSELN